MPDPLIRALEREAHLDPTAEAKLIIHRLRIGAVNIENIRLAAHLGHVPACLALRQPLPDSAWTTPTPTMEELWAAIHELEPFRRAALVRAALAAAELTVLWCDQELGQHDHLLKKLREAARRWLDQPTEEHARQAALLTARPLPHPYRGPAFASRFAACAVHEPPEHASRSAAVAVHLSVQAVGDVVQVRDVLRSALIDGAPGNTGGTMSDGQLLELELAHHHPSLPSRSFKGRDGGASRVGASA